MIDPGLRAVVSEDGERILLTIYGMSSSAIIAEMELSVLQAVSLASELTRAACALLWNEEINQSHQESEAK